MNCDCDCGSEIQTLSSEIEQLNIKVELLEAIVLTAYKLKWAKRRESGEVESEDGRFKIAPVTNNPPYILFSLQGEGVSSRKYFYTIPAAKEEAERIHLLSLKRKLEENYG